MLVVVCAFGARLAVSFAARKSSLPVGPRLHHRLIQRKSLPYFRDTLEGNFNG